MKTERAQGVPDAVNAAEASSNSTASEREPEQLWTMEDAFDGLCEPRKSRAGIGILDVSRDELNLERGIRSVAFLLDYLSEDGNTAVDGCTAQGLMNCLRFCASEASRLRKWHTWHTD
jgi:hypothetical protein